MPTLRSHTSLNQVKLLNIGDPGAGKTGALASLVKNRKELGIDQIIIQDWDDGVEILMDLLSGDELDAVYYEVFKNRLKGSELGPIPIGIPDAIPRALKMMNRWKTSEYDLGAAHEWGPETLFVSDTLTGMGDAAVLWARHAANAGINEPDWEYIGKGMGIQDKIIQMLCSLNCHMILNSHIRYLGGGGLRVIKDQKGSAFTQEVDSRVDGQGYPSALGKKLPPEIGRKFNTIVETKLQGNARVIRTVPDGNVMLKSSRPSTIPQEVKIGTGLYEIFKSIMGKRK